ncbi:hypothetical protein BPOR_0482g00030 [Botrytis porri]|uniref:Uncharacterized protein n=1 Tax=Botrytis porri TaxID=87229 RepID=A0A4Z1KGH1_9HELO|nr:hypothetical protein BPOR_0482g00030 [Botrytis porri]
MDDGKDQNAGVKRQNCCMSCYDEEVEVYSSKSLNRMKEDNPDQMETNPIEKKVKNKPSVQVVEVVYVINV